MCSDFIFIGCHVTRDHFCSVAELREYNTYCRRFEIPRCGLGFVGNGLVCQGVVCLLHHFVKHTTSIQFYTSSILLLYNFYAAKNHQPFAMLL